MEFYQKIYDAVRGAASGPVKATESSEAECESRYLQHFATAYEASALLELNRDSGHHSYLPATTWKK